jgi:iron complex outermembrane receptor protein
MIATWLAFILGAGPVSGADSEGNVEVGAGVIEGRILDPKSGEYIRNAEVRVEGTTILAVSQGDGRYRLLNVPAGNVTLRVGYTGFHLATGSVAVAPGKTSVKDFELRDAAPLPGDTIVALERFTVSSQREGTAKAIMEQRNSLTVKNVIASDTFGVMVEGNVAEVLQYLPGMEVVYCGGDPSTVAMRGMPARYGALMIDGVRTSANLGGARQPQIGSYSANAVDTIEFNKTNSADLDADAPAGSINLKSKTAFQRRGRFFAYQAYALVNSYALHAGKSDGPNDGQSYKTLPGVVLEYSDIFLGGKLGVVADLAETNSSNEQAIVAYTFDTAPTTANPTPVLLTTIGYTNAPKVNRRQRGGLNLDYKLSDRTNLAFRGQFNNEDARIYNRTFQLVSNRANLAAGSDATRMFANPTANNVTRVVQGGSTSMRTRYTHTFAPSVTYEAARWNLDATYSYTRNAQVQRNGRVDGKSASLVSANYQLFGVGFTADRHAVDEHALDFRQTSGPDLYELRNWIAPSTTNNLTRAPIEPATKSEVWQANAKFAPTWSVPTYLKTGLKTTSASYRTSTGSLSWTYVGPGGNRLTAEVPVSAYKWFDGFGGTLFTPRSPQIPDREALGSLLQKNPGYFIANPADRTSAANMYPVRRAEEQIDAAYVMGNTRLGKLSLQAGLRYEETKSNSTIYERNVPQSRSGRYDDLFASGSARYRITEQFMAIGSASQSISRVNLATMTGIATINDETLTGSIPNLELKPERANNYSARLEYYFEPVGVISAGVYMMDVTDLQFTSPRVPAEEIGFGDVYPGYFFSTMRNANSFTLKGLELEYSQQLSFLPGAFKGLGVFGNYSGTRVSDPTKAFGRAPEVASGGVSYRYRRFNGSLRAAWTANILQSTTTYDRARTMVGLISELQVTAHASIFLTGRNVLNAPITTYRSDLPGFISRDSKFGSNWTAGIKGRF